MGFFLAVTAALFFTSRDRFFFDPGSFWHVRIGEEIESRGFFRTDPLTYTQAGRHWVPTQWLAEVGMAQAHYRLGLDGLLWLALLTLAAFCAWLAGRFTRAGCHPLLTALFLVLFFALSSYHYHARPHLVTLVLLGLLLGFLADIEAKRLPFWMLIFLVPFFLLWVNLHGGVLGGMVTFGLVGIGWGMWFLFGWPSPVKNWLDVLGLAIVGGLCAATTLANPYGLDLLNMWLEIMRQELPTIINEHRPPSFDRPEAWALAGGSLLYLFLLAGTAPNRPRVVWLLPLVWLVQTWLRVRNGPLFAATALVAMADFLPHCRWFQAIAKRTDLYVVPSADEPPARFGWLNHAWLLLLPLPFLFPGMFRGQVRLDPGHWPVTLVPTLRHELRQANAFICHDDVFGGFLAYFVPESRIFLDDRCELHGRDLLLEYVALRRGTPGQAGPIFSQWVKKYRINLVLTRADSTLARYLRTQDDWKLLQQTDGEPSQRCVLFKRVSGPSPSGQGTAIIARGDGWKD